MEPNEDRVTFTIKKTHLYIAWALVIAFGSGFGAAWVLLPSSTGSPQVATQSTFQPEQQPPIVQVDIEGRPYLGPEDAPVTIVEFTDYECPFCGRHFRETLPQLFQEYEGTIKYVVLNFPISRIHPFAQQAGEAAECAYDQGKFWEYHDTLFQNQDALDVESLKRYAGDIGLNIDVFSACLDSGATAQRVLDDVQDGLSYGVNATPYFFINGQVLVGAQPFNSFQTLIDAALSR